MFKTPGPPTVVTKAASSVAQTTATLNATVNPNGQTVSECKFEYGTTEAYGKTASCTPSPGSGETPVEVSASVTGLTANTTYHFRIFASNSSAAGTGSDVMFKTPGPPTVVTKAASSVAQTTATLNATVNPNGQTVSECKFEYGTTEAYGKTASCTPSPGSGETPVEVSASVTGLTANTTYHFRIFASNSSAAGTGSDETFKTQASCTPEGFCRSFTPPNNIEGAFKEPDGVALDPSGDIFVADSGHDRVLEFNSNREYLRQFGTEGTGNGQFKGIRGIATNASGDVYAIDTANHRVQEFSPTGTYITQFPGPATRARSRSTQKATSGSTTHPPWAPAR